MRSGVRVLGELVTVVATGLSRLARRLGARGDLVPVSAVMLSRTPTVTPDEALEDVAQFFVGDRTAAVPVIEGGTPIAAVTRDDVTNGLAQKGPHAHIGDAPMHRVVTVAPSDSLGDVLARLRAAPEAIAIVVDRGTPVGVLTAERLVAYAREARGAA